MMSLRYSKDPLSQTIVALCEAKGIKHIVISPGSRNAPLTIGFTAHGAFECYSIVDERCAAFFALGIAQQLKQPTVLVCTSGSALLNYYPAIAEAFYSDIPIVIISADRPKEFVDIGDGQTIRQEYVFQNHVLYEANLLNTINVDYRERNEALINNALNTAFVEAGPVHINAPFYEPLYEKVGTPTRIPENEPPEYTTHTIDVELQNKIWSQWNEAPRKMVLIGSGFPEMIPQRWIDLLVEDPSVLLVTETIANIDHQAKIGCIDQLIAPLVHQEKEALKPNILLTFGGMVVSKKIKAFLRTYQPGVHWHVDPKNAPNTYFCLSEHIKMSPKRFFNNFMIQIAIKESDYQSRWLAERDKRRAVHQKYLKRIPFTDFLAFDHVLKAIPDYSMLQLGNSSAIRYSQLFEVNPTLSVFCNRGTSGIDGSTSTAIGAAVVSERLTTFVTGDLSFLYDSNGLWNRYIPITLRIVVINNSGGGIFRILPGKEDSELFDTFFETTHQLTAKHLCAMHGLGYQKVRNEFELENALETFYQPSKKPQLLEVFTPRELNDSILIEYFKLLG